MDANDAHNKIDDVKPAIARPPVPTQTSTPSSNVETLSQEKPQHSSAGAIVLQWLTYAFWGWLIGCLIWVTSVVLVNAILGENVTEMIPYTVAGTVVLLPLALVTDFFYRKHEPTKKAGGAMVLMVVHTVLFALLSIVSLIIAVFVGLNIALNIDRDTDSQLVGILTALTSAVLFAGAFLRTLNPLKAKRLAFIYGIVMGLITLALLVFAVTGPIVSSLATRNDRLIERGLSDVKYAIDDYVATNNKLPESLNALRLDNDDAEALVEQNLVEYKPEGRVTLPSTDVTDVTLPEILLKAPSNYRYQLCVEYQKASDTKRGNQRSDVDKDYSPYLNTYTHPAGPVCYKLQTQTVY